MKGYYKPIKIDEEDFKVIKKHIMVGCNRCKTKWFEEIELFSFHIMNECYFKYDACDDCIKEEEKSLYSLTKYYE